MRCIVERLFKVAVSTATEDLEVNPRSTQERIRWTRLLAFDATTATTYTEVGMKHGSSRYPAARAAAPAAHAGVDTDVPLELQGEWVPYARFAGATANDELHFIAFGYHVDET